MRHGQSPSLNSYPRSRMARYRKLCCLYCDSLRAPGVRQWYCPPGLGVGARQSPAGARSSRMHARAAHVAAPLPSTRPKLSVTNPHPGRELDVAELALGRDVGRHTRGSERAPPSRRVRVAEPVFPRLASPPVHDLSAVEGEFAGSVYENSKAAGLVATAARHRSVAAGCCVGSIRRRCANLPTYPKLP